MAILNNSNAISSGGYDINNSLRFRSSASARLSRTFGTASNYKIQTLSLWVKRGLLSSSATYRLMGGYDGSSSNSTEINFNNDNLRIEFGGAANNALITTQVFRDPSAWYHIVVAIDTTQATAANRVKMYVNGNQITAFGTANYPAQNAVSQLTSANANNSIGAGWSGFEYFDGYMTEINFIDGQALTPSSFGETDTTTGSWKPKAYTGTYGTNGFYLKFSDIATTSGSNAGLGKDFSGNANYWTTNNISVTSGTTYDAMIDSPTLTSATVANYAVMNPLAADSNATFSNANLTIASNAAGEGFIPATIDFDIASSTGYYFEVTVDSGTAYCTTGFIPVSKFPGKMWTGGAYPGQSTYNPGFEIRFSDGTILQNGGSSAYGSGATAGDTWGFAIKNGKVWARNSSGWFNSGNPVTEANPAVTGQTGQWLLGFAERAGAFGAGCTYNFGQRPFSYTPPTGFVRLNTFNLPDSTIKKGNTVMDATLWTGTGSSLAITNSGAFKPDFVWGKRRNGVADNILIDSIVGGNPPERYLSSNTTSGTTANADVITSLNSNGFTVGTSGALNGSSNTYVGWQWQAGQGTTSSNTSGTITSTVSVNATAGFSIVTYTGTGSTSTVGHGLGVAPKMLITKRRNTTGDWSIYNSNLGANKVIWLNQTTASTTDGSPGHWNNTAPTSSVFTVGTDTDVNASSSTYVAYCWAEIAGFSKFGSYTGNGSADGPFVYTGFRPKFIIIKCTSNADSWYMLDTSRSTYNATNQRLFANASSAESSGDAMDILSNGFKNRSSTTLNNLNGGTYIYMAFAENPFKNANAR
jgi:hypothetical protein